ncbi:MAG: lysophospholipid acyltransferase family protein [Deltaproteobacteria bacterium]
MVYVLRYLAIVVITVVCLSPLLVWSLIDRSGEPGVRLARVWARWILRAIGIRVETVGLENLDLERPGVLMSNHRSAFDIVALVVALPTSFRFVAKKELTYIPIFGWVLALSGQIVIDRSKRAQAIHMMEEAARHIQGATKILIFPEGTRSGTDEMRAFKSGGFHLAQTQGWPIFPVGIAGSEAVTPKGSLRIERGTIRLVFGERIATGESGAKSRNQLRDETRQQINGLIAQAARELADGAAAPPPPIKPA